jgi:hypothetical protein
MKAPFNSLFFSLHFRGVGQGLFSHGHLERWIEKDSPTAIPPRFEWVYDCGAEKLGTHLWGQITEYTSSHNKGDIDLLMLSHFDQDHVLGIRELLKKRKPKVIVAPYLSITRRLEALAALDTHDSEYAGFLIAPATTLRRYAGKNTRIVFVEEGGGPAPETPDGDATNPNFPWPSDREKRKTSVGGEPAAPSNDPDDTAMNSHNTHRIDGRIPFVVWGMWEFCFFNIPRPEMEANLATMADVVLQRFNKTKKRADDYVKLIADLRHVFEAVRGPGNRPRKFDANEISLVVYSGPVPRPTIRFLLVSPPTMTSSTAPALPTAILRRAMPRMPIASGRCGTLFTGDITLTESIYTELMNHFGSPRLNFVSFFQVPHHGSKLSYRLTPSSGFQPDFSIFSSARYHAAYDHPSEVVIEKLKDCGPLFVNEFQGLTTGGAVVFP